MINLSKNQRESVKGSLLQNIGEAFSQDIYLAENVEDYISSSSGIQLPWYKQLSERGVAKILIKDVSLSRVVDNGIIRPYWFDMKDSSGEVRVFWDPVFALAQRDDGFRSRRPLEEVFLKYTLWDQSSEVEKIVSGSHPRRNNYSRKIPQSQVWPGRLQPL